MKGLKKNKDVTNLFINNQFIAFKTKNTTFINISDNGKHIGWWLSNKFIYLSQNYEDYTAIGIINENDITIWKHDFYLKRYFWKKINSNDLIEMYQKAKENYNSRMKESLFGTKGDE